MTCVKLLYQKRTSVLKNGHFWSVRMHASLFSIQPTATMDVVDEARLFEEVSRTVDGGGDRTRKAAGIAGAIRRAGAYRWVGLYEVAEREIANLASFPTRFPKAGPSLSTMTMMHRGRAWRIPYMRCLSDHLVELPRTPLNGSPT